MIILDTNVVSALMQPEPDVVLVQWLDKQPHDSVWLTAISIFEVRFGIDMLGPSRRRRQLEDGFARVLDRGFRERIIALDENCAAAATSLAAERKRRGTPVDLRDTLIAGIAMSRTADLATRNIRHFKDLELRVVDPWQV